MTMKWPEYPEDWRPDAGEIVDIERARDEFDAEVLERLRKYFQTQINNLNADEMVEGPFDDGTEDGELWEQAAARIDAKGGLRVRFEFGPPPEDD